MKFERCDRCGVEGRTTKIGNTAGHYLPKLPEAWSLDLCPMCEAAVKAVAMRKLTVLQAPTATRRWWRLRRGA